MRNVILIKGIVIGIIFLFIGTSVIPVVNANVGNSIIKNYKEVITKFFSRIKNDGNIEKISHESQFLNILDNHSEDYKEFKDQYDRFRGWCHDRSYLEYWEEILSVKFTYMLLINLFGGPAVFYLVKELINLPAAILITLGIFGTIDSATMWWEWRIAAWAGVLNAASVRLSVLCQYTENN